MRHPEPQPAQPAQEAAQKTRQVPPQGPHVHIRLKGNLYLRISVSETYIQGYDIRGDNVG